MTEMKKAGAQFRETSARLEIEGEIRSELSLE